MKTILAVLFITSAMFSQTLRWQNGQGIIIPYNNVATDSVVWSVSSIDSAHLGNDDCQHVWVESEEYTLNNGMSCGVFHNGFHCSWNDGYKDRICRVCYRKETIKETWYQHRYVPPKTEYEILNEKLEDKK